MSFESDDEKLCNEIVMFVESVTRGLVLTEDQVSLTNYIVFNILAKASQDKELFMELADEFEKQYRRYKGTYTNNTNKTIA